MDFANLSNEHILAELGQRIAQQRLNANIKQAELAYEAGISRKTLSNLENGHSVQLESLIRILKALKQIDQLELMLPPPQVSPIAMADLQGKQRKRASSDNITDISTEWQWPQ